MAGFPNGRRLADDTPDIELRALAGGTPFTPDFNIAPNNKLGDGVNTNDTPFLNQFPYVGTPTRGTPATRTTSVAAPRLRSEPLGEGPGSGPLPGATHPRRPGRAVGLLAAVLAVTVAAGVLVGRFLVAGDGAARPAPPVAAADSGAVVARLQAELRQRPDEPRLLTRLGVAYVARARETADPTFYAKASGVLEQATRLAPGDPDTMVARGLLELGRHDFKAALAWGTRAKANPDLPDALGVIFDAQVELGRYQAAVVTAQAMVDRKPTQGSLARVSYARELLGDPAGAVAAMVQAAAAGGDTADRAYVQTLIGNLHLGAGRLAPAEAAYRRALDGLSGYGLAEVGLARAAAARGPGRRGPAAGAGRGQPAPAGHRGPARRRPGRPRRRPRAGEQYRLVRVIERLNQANGVEVDLELARFEADHARDQGADPAGGGHGPARPGRAADHLRLRHPRLGPAPGRQAPPGPPPRPGARSGSAPATRCSGTTWPPSRPTWA